MKPTAKIIAILSLLVLCSTSLADLGDPNLLEAQLLALEVSGQLRPPTDLTELILNDLAAIRAAFPYVAHITYRWPFMPGEILVGLTEEAVIQFQQGQYHALDELNSLYGVVGIDLLDLTPGVIKLKFNQIYNAELLSEIYAQANPEGLIYAQPNHTCCDGSTISADPPFYTFIVGLGDCPVGCTYHESYRFRVENGQATALDDRYVDAINGNDDNNGLSPNTAFATIQKAVDAIYINGGYTVIVAPGTYAGSGNRDIDSHGKVVSVRSINPNDPNIVASTIIDCDGTQAEPHRGFYLSTYGVYPATMNSIVAGFTIRNGYANEGGGIYCPQSNSKIKNCIIIGNFAAYGGGISCDYKSNPTITNCTITGNSAEYGGGLFKCDGPITNCTITNNSAKYGGGGLYGCRGPITNCIITDNNDGGGIYGCDGPITNCTITGNSTVGSGGGIYHCEGPITNCTITGNSAEYNGGGIYVCDGPITNCIITGNSSVGSGGGLCDCEGPITNCIITGNSSVGSGGGLSDCYGPITNCIITGNSTKYKYGGGFSRVIGPVINCTITGNSAVVSGGGLYFVDEATNCIICGNWPEQIYTNFLTITYSNVQGGWTGQGNIDADPCFVQPGYWADANDPNIIVEPNDPNATWIDGDYHLKSEGWSWDIKRSRWTYDDVTSRCIDAGNPGSPLGDELLSVPDDPNNIWGQNLRINMGAYGGTAEASMPPYDWTLLGDLTNDGLVNLKDYAFQAADWLNSADQQPGDLNRDSLVDISDLVLLVEDWLKQTTWHE
jgi:hypothetical protein